MADQSLIEQALKGNLIEELGLMSLAEEEKLALIRSLTDLAGLRFTTRIIERLAPLDRTEFEKMTSSVPPESAVLWLRERGIDFEEMLLEEISRLKDELRERGASLPQP
ncbi:MAG: hypothetical protein HYT40_03955 [Candidatus Sungbacteria bacterium]|uniref:Uncharacterized protein n=1 Tax=Candidatus Sungiibacteriota bacterium TaxID=2750080 RepID=A0A931SC94_9BACT|nr:hypothetical protein [Candidatus Sungbacteria bacterium]